MRARHACIPDLRLGFPVPLGSRPATYAPRRGRLPLAGSEEPVPDHTHRHHRANQGQPERLLAEIKICGAGPTRYPRNSIEKAMDRRARLLPAEYRKKVADVDREHHGTAPGEVGPLQARLEELAGGEGLQSLLGL